MGRIIYNGRRVSHFYLWVAIAFNDLGSGEPLLLAIDISYPS